jgi:hypothetical protein
MLVTFTTDAHADITLFGEVAHALLKMMGHSGTVPSAILAADVPATLNRLTVAINAENILSPAQELQQPEVSMKNRALPLIDLLTAAAAAKANVMWK